MQMDYGIIVNSPTGNIQIDSTFKNVVLKQNYNNVGLGSWQIFNFASQSTTPPLLGMVPATDYYTSFAGLKKVDNNYVGLAIFRENKSASGYIGILECGQLPNTPLHGKYGIEVYNANGDVCFNSEANYLKVFTRLRIDLPGLYLPHFYYSTSEGSMYVEIEHAGISNPFYILSPCWSTVATVRREIIDNIGVHYNRCLSLGLRKISSTKVRVSFFVWQPYTWSNYWINPTHVPSSCDLLICGI